MKSLCALIFAVFVACVTGTIVWHGYQWSAMFMLAPLCAGILVANIINQIRWADRDWEFACSFFAGILFFFSGVSLGVFAIAAYAEMPALTPRITVMGTLMSFGLATIGFIVSLVTSPNDTEEDEVADPAPSTPG